MQPKDVTLPFWSYGIFMPGELGFLKIKEYVESCEDKYMDGELYLLDGIPLFEYNSKSFSKVKGTVINFKKGQPQIDAYKEINSVEPDIYYKWEIIDGLNILESRIEKQEMPFIDSWSSKDDPYFADAFTVLDDIIDKYKSKSKKSINNTKSNLLLNMGYMLLWTMIERYCTLRYKLGNESGSVEGSTMRKIINLKDDPIFRKESEEFAPRINVIFNTSSPSDKWIQYNTERKSKDGAIFSKYENSLRFFYQIRCNLVHRGKIGDEESLRVYEALSKLRSIFEKIYKKALLDSDFKY